MRFVLGQLLVVASTFGVAIKAAQLRLGWSSRRWPTGEAVIVGGRVLEQRSYKGAIGSRHRVSVCATKPERSFFQPH